MLTTLGSDEEPRVLFSLRFMKKYLPFILLFLASTAANSQDEKRDYIWLFGKYSEVGDSTWGGTVIDFNYGPPDIYYDSRDMNFDITNANICDENGNLLFYTNGRFIANKFNDTVINSTGINPGIWSQSYGDDGLRLYQGALILPKPESNHLFYLLHEEREFVGGVQLTVVPRLYYTIIDMSFQGGSGLATQLNTVMVQDTLDYGKITATRHANGRDWWIVVGEFYSNRYYRFLLGPNGIEEQEPQRIGEAVPSGLGQAHFSPDGTKYTKLNGINDSIGVFLDIYDFNRCSGILNSKERIIYETLSGGAGGLSFSPNSRFLYVCEGIYVFQYDLWANDIAASVDTVAEYDGFLSPFPTTFFMAQLAPDGKIYINSPNSVDVLHVIHQPNEKGAACQFEQHGVQLAALNHFSLPNFPNYRLGALEGSPCDTLETVAVEEEITVDIAVKVFPNPVRDELTIYYQSKTDLTFTLYDLNGQLIFQDQLATNGRQKIINVAAISSGLYLYKALDQNGVLVSGKITILR